MNTTIEQFNFKGLTAFVRVDFNVPLDSERNITDDTRMRAALPTLKKILADGGKLIIASHLGRPKGVDENLSLKHLLPHLEELLGLKVQFPGDSIGEKVQHAVKSLHNGEALLLENLRFYAEEEGKPRGLSPEASPEEVATAKKEMKQRQRDFADKLASLADCYVNDAFGTAHRAHASTALIADKFPPSHKMFGFLMEKEVKAVKHILQCEAHPFVAIVGGAKVSSKIDILSSLLNKADKLIVTGGMAFTFVVAEGGQIGKSLFEPDNVAVAKGIIEKAKAQNVELILPLDVVASTEFSNDSERKVFPINAIPKEYMGLDVGPQTRACYKEALHGAKTILWNGPAGVFEMENFRQGTFSLAEAVADATKEGAYSLVGGGDSVACIKLLGMEDKISYVSTGGGALLEAVEGKALPGVVAIQGEK